MIDHINPALRYIDNVNGKKRVREFYAMSAEAAYLIFEAMAEIYGTTDLLVKIKPDKKQEEEEETANEVKEIAREKPAPFSFDLVQIAAGEEVEFWYTAQLNSVIMCKVVDSKHIEYEGEVYSLSSFATMMVKSKHGVAGPRYFKYKGEWLNGIRDGSIDLIQRGEMMPNRPWKPCFYAVQTVTLIFC